MNKKRDMSWRAKLCGSIAACVASAMPALAARSDVIVFETVVLSGDTAPGTGAARFSFLSLPHIDDAGRVAFLAFLEQGFGGVTADNDQGIWSEGSGALSLIARSGATAPGTGAAVFSGFFDPVLSRDGRTAFLGFLRIGVGGVTFDNDSGSWSQGGGPLALIAREGSPAPGAGGAVFETVGFPSLNPAGQTATVSSFRPGIGGVTINNNEAVYSEGGGSLALLARESLGAPGAPGAVFSSFGAPIVINAAGQTAFEGFLRIGTGGVTNDNNNGIWSEGSGSLGLVAREGDIAPGAGSGVFLLALFPSINDAGQTALLGNLRQGIGGVTADNQQGVWSQGGGSLALVARQGDIAPGTTGEFGGFTPPVINGAGDTALLGFLKIGVGGVTGDNAVGIWTNVGGTLSLIVRAGQTAPGAGSAVFQGFNTTPAFNSAGQSAFLGFLKIGVGGVTNDNHRGIWCHDPLSDEVLLVARQGDLFEVAPGDFRTISFLQLIERRGGQDGLGTSLNEFGELAFHLTFTDGSQGIFVASRGEDCNNSGIDDATELADGTVYDCDCNGLIDQCEIDDDPSLDLNGSGFLDSCERCPDINCDGVVWISDLFAVLVNFGQTGVNKADVNFDGIVNFADYLYVLFRMPRFCGW